MAQQPPAPRYLLGAARAASILNVLVGLWLILAPFVLGYGWLTRAAWNDFFIGALVLALALARVLPPGASVTLSWVNLALGVWLVASPFVLAYAGVSTALWNDVLAGLLIVGLAATTALAAPRPGSPSAR